MDQTVEVNDQYYILATSPRRDELRRVLKQADTFAVFDHFGNIESAGGSDHGIYHEGTRHVSRWDLMLGGRRPLLLSSTVRHDNSLLTVDLTNPDLEEQGEIRLARDTVHAGCGIFLQNGVCYLRISVRNYALHAVALKVSVRFAADFADIFEVRGTKRDRRGELLGPEIEPAAVTLSYRGLDEVVRATRFCFSPVPEKLTATAAAWMIDLPPQGEQVYDVVMDFRTEDANDLPGFDITLKTAATKLRRVRSEDALVEAANDGFNDWLKRSAADLQMMITETSHGEYPYAGVPWFSTVFGRDGIITALEYLWVNPALAKGVLSYLAATQSDRVDPGHDAEPGKIVHEMRQGEMAALGEIPFGRYYGSVDATPLFIMLVWAYYQRTADREFIASMWPHVKRALRWIDEFGDSDGDGFFEYARHSSQGLVSQGWKDSFDSVFHADGTLAPAPVALCEVQGYIYAARQAAAELALVLGETSQSSELFAAARCLQEQFEQVFWCEDLSTYGLALDGDKKLCRVRTSNAGHCLFSGIVSGERANRVADTLLDASSYSGWGIRTVAVSESRYNPMSYHNGSIWPHDNALIALGFSHYGLQERALQVLSGLFDASLFVDLNRMPELFCGFDRRASEGPTLYPVACAPQSWAAGAVFMLLQACLGLSMDAPLGQIRLHRPKLPESIPELAIRNLRLGNSVVDLMIKRYPHDVAVSLSRRMGNVEVIIVK